MSSNGRDLEDDPRQQLPARADGTKSHKRSRGQEDHLVATSDIGSWMKVMPTLFKAAPSEDYEWWYPTPKGVGDAWAPFVLGDGHRLSSRGVVRQVEEGAETEFNLALEDDWRHVIEAWDHGCKSRYRSSEKVRQAAGSKIKRVTTSKAALNACWEFAHEPSNATSCGSLARQVAANVSSEDPAIRNRGVPRGLAPVRGRRGYLSRTSPTRFGLSSGRRRGTTLRRCARLSGGLGAPRRVRAD